MHTVLATLDGRPIFLAQPDIQSETTEQKTGEENAAGDQQNKPQGLLDNPMVLIMIVGLMVLWIFMLGGGSRKQKKKQAEMLASMTKGSKIVTIGGIKGSVVEVRDDEVVVKVDENSNTRMKFSRDAIRTVIDAGAASDKDEKQGKDSK